MYSENFLKYLKNSSWMLTEYFLKVISAIFVTIYIARFLGPESFGILMYALAIVAVFMALSRLGMESILVRELAQRPEAVRNIMGTAFYLMLLFALISIAILGLLVTAFEADPDIRLYIWIIATGLIAQIFFVADYNFQSQVRAKYSSIAKVLALTVSSLVKIYLVIIEVELLALVIAFALDFTFAAIFLSMMHFIKQQPPYLLNFDIALVKPLLKSAWPMVLSSLAIILYMRVDQIMIKNMLDNYQVGIYSAGTRVYEGWIMIFVILSASLLPAIVKLKKSSNGKYEKSLCQLFALLFWSGMVGTVIATVFGGEIINLAFGKEYAEASTVFIIIMWSAPFAAIGSMTVRYLTAEGMEKKIAVRTFVALVINASLNFILIPAYGIEGAAVATLVTIIFSNYLINFFDGELNQLCSISSNAILFRRIISISR